MLTCYEYDTYLNILIIIEWHIYLENINKLLSLFLLLFISVKQSLLFPYLQAQTIGVFYGRFGYRVD